MRYDRTSTPQIFVPVIVVSVSAYIVLTLLMLLMEDVLLHLSPTIGVLYLCLFEVHVGSRSALLGSINHLDYTPRFWRGIFFKADGILTLKIGPIALRCGNSVDIDFNTARLGGVFERKRRRKFSHFFAKILKNTGKTFLSNLVEIFYLIEKMLPSLFFTSTG